MKEYKSVDLICIGNIEGLTHGDTTAQGWNDLYTATPGLPCCSDPSASTQINTRNSKLACGYFITGIGYYHGQFQTEQGVDKSCKE